MKKIKKSYEAFCADASSVFPTWQVRRLKKEWLKNAILFRGVTNIGDRVVTPCVISTDYHQVSYLMDCVTGTLYKDGKCKTSDRIRLLDVKEEAGLADELMQLRTKALGG